MTTEKRAFKWIRAEIERLDPEVDSEQIVRLTSCRLIPKSLLVVHLFYTVGFVRFAGPPVSAESVDRNGTGMLYDHGSRRADETMFHLFSWIDDGVSSPTSIESLDFVRNWHSGVARNWPMPMHTFQHSAAVFALGYDRLLRHIAGAPGLSDNERRAQLIHWRKVSEGLGVADIPHTWQDMEQLLESYESSADFAYSPAGRRLADALIDQFATRWFPRPLRWFGRWLALAFSEDHVIDTLGIPKPPAAFRYAVRRLARIAVFAEHHLLPDPREVFRLGDIITGHKKSALVRPSVPAPGTTRSEP
ncbi:oxygenase MpaB family protein [Nocardia carnea]|uniref:oxygenase MpaB family protein n=1 Tax=Nocardia carnea TaxID=37328 RepID=UPI002457DF3F|nr:oxygenase MpaB family protein [Nocardia carnea]